MTEEKNTTKEFKGKYISSVGRRKTAAAQVRMYKNGSGVVLVNNLPLKVYFPTVDLQNTVIRPLVVAGLEKKVDLSVIVKGGGKIGQATAVGHGVARAILANDKEAKPVLRAEKLLTRDSRRKERKKPGLKKARRAPQWSKR
ncbi:30S ribosomal protein S9 [Candidatus Falkowbacteria bacterium CG10_big_fil_rev_8_21_14_0_10_37_6]|uniref:30S ribosomal protein S9 n=1 Tax=Candidatus Falkowbacteria bacterium CG10_big_fil_rev_8_21_14_0_10_37_6 TaxID=1974563 RepID=A0A2H0V6U9_9BACT|nr:MAG: 30S ribosomal protein S9 [Candidatus Falkowbacteria bacterium CG10_big_fil_rev_8_21_14_0_10_37_6]